MVGEVSKIQDTAAAGLVCRPAAADVVKIKGRYEVECFDKDGKLKWRDVIDNVIATVGVNDMLDKYLAGSAWTTGTVYMGLKSTGTAVAADTMASHASWTELNITASSGVRQSVAFAAASARAKATSAASSFSVTTAGPTNVGGCFIVVGGTSANGNTTGTLFSAGDFTVTPRSVVSGDTLNVTYSSTLT